jgi:hypothetical protein
MKKFFAKTDWLFYVLLSVAVALTMLLVAPITTLVQEGEPLVVPVWYSHAAFFGVMVSIWAFLMLGRVLIQATYQIVKNAMAAGTPPV